MEEELPVGGGGARDSVCMGEDKAPCAEQQEMAFMFHGSGGVVLGEDWNYRDTHGAGHTDEKQEGILRLKWQ